MDNDGKHDIRDYFLIIIMAVLFGLSNFTFSWMLLIKIPLLASFLVLIHAVGLYLIRKDD